MKRCLIAILLLLCLHSVAQKDVFDKSKNKTIHYAYIIITAESNTYGYDIYADKKLLIHQPNKPGLPGNEGFVTREKATIVAKLAIKKLAQGVMPPTITKEEMQELKVIP